MTAANFQSNDTNDGVLVMDEQGNLKILSHGQLVNFQDSGKPAVVASNLPIDTGMEEKMLQPPPPVVRQTNASFYFHPEDEDDVAKIKNQPAAAIDPKRYSLGKIIHKILENFQLSLNETEASRLKNLTFSFLRDRRNLVDFQESLERNKASGGLDLTAEQTDKVLTFLKEIKVKIFANGGLVVDEDQEEAKPAASAVNKAVLTKPAVVKPVPRVVAEIASASSINFKPVPPLARPMPKSVDSSDMLKVSRHLKDGVMSDVKRDYKLIGPLEELSGLDLLTFHRLGKTAAERGEKIIKKMEFLAQESLIKKAAGIKAWRTSPLYKMYLALGQTSMENNVPVEQVIVQYQQAGKEIITLEEFEIISDINRRLRF